MFTQCYNCGEGFEAWYEGEDLCQECQGELEDYDDDSDIDEESDFGDSIYWAYYAADVPDPFDVKVKPRRRRWLRWSRPRRNRYAIQILYGGLAGLAIATF